MGVSVEKLAADTNRCLYLDAAAAKVYGIVDKVVVVVVLGVAMDCGIVDTASE